MQPIEFRALVKTENKLYPVSQIDFETETVLIEKVRITKLDKHTEFNFYEVKVKFEDIELMQYTTKDDINGTKIFEGDKVEVSLAEDFDINNDIIIAKKNIPFQGIVEFKDAMFVINLGNNRYLNFNEVHCEFIEITVIEQKEERS